MYMDNLQPEVAKRLKAASAFSLCPLDGRYVGIATSLWPYFSTFALQAHRTVVEVEWFIALTEQLSSSDILKEYDPEMNLILRSISEEFSLDDFEEISDIEKETNHDVKSVEIFLQRRFKALGLEKFTSFIHFGCTSEDITNLAYGLMIKSALNDVIIPEMEAVSEKIYDFALEYASTPMLAHTHGQKATPTTVGKEFMVYASRLSEVIENLKCIPIYGKFNGATGNYSADSVAFPEENWPEIAEDFVTGHIGLEFNPVTTQIEPHDYICEICDAVRHFNNILIDFDLDMWLYISMDYFKQIPVKGEVGSSTMPHKVNPIRFENSEASVWFSNAVLLALSDKLPRSRMQRDLSDSATMRNLGMALGYSLQAIRQTLGGLKKVEVHTDVIENDLDNSWEVLAEPIQTMMRKYGMSEAYNTLKEMTRGKDISQEDILKFVASLSFLSAEDKETLSRLTPATYIGYAAYIAEEYFSYK